jgi:ligand-binding sensor domain-containing protein/signal transduction histidine kinase
LNLRILLDAAFGCARIRALVRSPSSIRLLAALAVVAAVSAAPAQALDPKRRLTQYIHEVWSVKHGLPHNSVRAVVQDHQGYLWIATRKGLLRFDGQSFTPIPLEPNDVLSLGTASEGVWVGTSKPGHVYLVRNGAVAAHYHDEALARTKIEKLYEDQAGRLWIGTEHGLYRVEGGRIEAVPLAGDTPTVIAIVGDGSGGVWIGARSGLFHWTAEGLEHYTTRDGLAGDDVRSLVKDATGALWIGVRSFGLTRWRDGVFDRFGVAAGLPDGTVFALTVDGDGILWIGTGKGLVRFYDGRILPGPAPKGIAADLIEDVYVDQERGLWISTQDRGLHRLRDGAIFAYGREEGLPAERIWSVQLDGDAFWIGTDEGITRWREGESGGTVIPIRNCEGEGRVSVVFVDSRGTVWLGARGRVFRMTPGGTPRPVDLGGVFECWPVDSIAEDARGAMWIASRDVGLVRLMGSEIRVYTDADGLPGTGVRIIRRLRDGTLWAGTTHGAARLKDDRWVSEGGPRDIMTMLEDRDGTLWVGTASHGLYRHAKDWLSLSTEQGLPTDQVLAIEEDSHGYVWVMCEKGVYRVNKREFVAAAEGRVALPATRLYGETDGMRSLIPFGSREPGVEKTEDGRIWFATPNGLAIVDPERLLVNTMRPPAVIEAVLRNGQVVAGHGAGPMEFPAGTANYDFHYTALSLVAQDRAVFQYQLEGIDEDWVDAGSRRRAYYAQLPPGSYTFRVRAQNEDGYWSEKPGVFQFRQRPFFHQTPSFYVTCAVALLLAGAGFNILRVRRMAVQQVRLTRLVDERTAQLDRAKQQLEEANHGLEKRVAEGIEALREAERMAAYGQMIAAVAHEVRHPVFALQAAAYVLRDTLPDDAAVGSQLRTLDSETRRLNALMTDLLEFGKPAVLQRSPAHARELFDEAADFFRAEGFTIPVDIEIAPDTPDAVLDRFRVVQALLNLMRNAALHATGLTHITLHAGTTTCEGTAALRLTVRDDGAGMAPEYLTRIFEPFVTGGKGTGLGLAIVRRLAVAHGGEATVESTPGRGSAFHLDFPVEPVGASEAAQRLTNLQAR